MQDHWARDCRIGDVIWPDAASRAAHAETLHTEVACQPGDILLFGPEPTGLGYDVLGDPCIRELVRIPMRPGMRSLNLANAVGVYGAWRQLGYPAGYRRRHSLGAWVYG